MSSDDYAHDRDRLGHTTEDDAEGTGMYDNNPQEWARHVTSDRESALLAAAGHADSECVFVADDLESRAEWLRHAASALINLADTLEGK